MLGNIVHVVSNNLAHLLELIRDFRREIIVVVLSLLPAANVGFDAQRKTVEQLVCFLRVYRLDVHRQHHLARQSHEVVDQLIGQARCELFDEKHAHKALICLDIIFMITQCQRTENISNILPARNHFVQICLCHAVIWAEKVMQNTETAVIVLQTNGGRKALHTDAQAFAGTTEKLPGIGNILTLGSEGHKFLLNDAVTALRLGHNHLIQFCAVFVHTVMLLAQEQRSCVGFLVEYTVYQSDFHAAVCRKTVQYTPPAVQNGALIVQTGYGIVNIGKRPCLAEFVVADLPD